MSLIHDAPRHFFCRIELSANQICGIAGLLPCASARSPTQRESQGWGRRRDDGRRHQDTTGWRDGEGERRDSPGTNTTTDMAFYSSVFNIVFKRNSTFVASIFAATFLLQVGLDEGVTRWYENRNKGKLWADLKPKVLAGFETEEAEDDE